MILTLCTKLGEAPQECVSCHCRLTTNHILVDVLNTIFQIYKNIALQLFNNVSQNKIISFIKRARLYT